MQRDSTGTVGRRGRPRLTLAAAGPPRSAGGGRGRRPRPGAWAWLLVLPLGIAVAALTVYLSRGGSSSGGSGGGRAAPGKVVVASVPYWNISNGTAAVLARRGDVSEVSPWMYGLGAGSRIVLDSGINAAATGGYLSQLRTQGLLIVPTLANVDPQGNWAYRPVASMLHDRALMTQQIGEIVALVQQHHYAGIDIDYEDLHPGDRQAFTTFIARLASALHAKGKILSVALFAKASNAGYAPRNLAQDYAAIGRAADQVRLMGYDYHWATSPPGPVAPLSWLQAVLGYARSQIPASKIILGIPFYGYDWSGGHGAGLTWARAVQLAGRHHARVHYDTTSQSPWFSYTDSAGHRHTVWFEDARSTRAKFSLARKAGIGGVYLWMYGNPDPATWSALRHALPIGRPTTAPARGSGSP